MGQSKSKPVVQAVAQVSPFYQSVGPCKFSDKGYFMWRMRQLELINYAIKKITTVLSIPAEEIDYSRLLDEIANYGRYKKTGDEASYYTFNMVADDDETFKGYAETTNKFADFLANAKKLNEAKAIAPADAKTKLRAYLDAFINLRDNLSIRVMQECQ